MLRFDQFVVVNRTVGVLLVVVRHLAAVAAHHHGDGATVRIAQCWRGRVQMTRNSLLLLTLMVMTKMARMTGRACISCRTGIHHFARCRVSLSLTFASLCHTIDYQMISIGIK